MNILQAYFHARYLNLKVVLDNQDKTMRMKLLENTWVKLNIRVIKDEASPDEVKDRIKEALAQGFMPVKRKRD